MSSNNTTTNEIAARLARIYLLFIDFDYIAANDMKWAPHSAQDLDPDLCHQVGLDDDAIAFLEKIPWPAAGSGDLIKDSEMIDFSEPSSLAASRFGVPTPAIPTPGPLLSLTFYGDKGHSLLVDTVQGTIRKWDGSGDPMAEQERPACAVLDDIYNSYLTLAEIPYELEILQPTLHSVSNVSQSAPDGAPFIIDTKYLLVKAAALENGWPNTFSAADFKRVAARDIYIMEGGDDDEDGDNSDDSLDQQLAVLIAENDEDDEQAQLPNGII